MNAILYHKMNDNIYTTFHLAQRLQRNMMLIYITKSHIPIERYKSIMFNLAMNKFNDLFSKNDVLDFSIVILYRRFEIKYYIFVFDSIKS